MKIFLRHGPEDPGDRRGLRRIKIGLECLFVLLRHRRGAAPLECDQHLFGSQPRNAQVPPHGWMTATRQPVARQRWPATDAVVPCQSGRDGRSEAWRLWQPLQWKRCDQKISSQHHLSLMYHSPPRHAPVARQFDFVIFTASIGGSISTEPHLAVPNRWPAPFIRNAPSNRPASEPASGMSIE